MQYMIMLKDGLDNIDKNCRRRSILKVMISPLWRHSHMTSSVMSPF